MSVLAFQHRERQLAERSRIRRYRCRRCGFDEPGCVEQFVEDAWRRAEKFGFLLQVDADAAEEDARFADVRLVGQRRRIERNEHDVVSTRFQLCGERVVAQATAAIHSRRACGDEKDLHMLALCNARGLYRKSTMLPSCGWSQFSRMVGTGPRFNRSMCVASRNARRNAGFSVIAVHTSVGPIASSSVASGHSTRRTTGNIQSVEAMPASGACDC